MTTHWRNGVVAALKEFSEELQLFLETHPKELPASNVVLDELLRLKGEVKRSLERLG